MVFKMLFAPNSPIFPKNCGREQEDDGERQLQSVTQKYIVAERTLNINMISHHCDRNIFSYYTAEEK